MDFYSITRWLRIEAYAIWGCDHLRDMWKVRWEVRVFVGTLDLELMDARAKEHTGDHTHKVCLW